jgi:hypothetical protein
VTSPLANTRASSFGLPCVRKATARHAEVHQFDNCRLAKAKPHSRCCKLRGKPAQDNLFAKFTWRTVETFCPELVDRLCKHDIELTAIGSSLCVTDDALSGQQHHPLNWQA